MKSQAVFLKHTKTLELLSTKVSDAPSTSTTDGKVIYAEFHVPVKPAMPSGAIDIDDLVAEFEQTTESAEAIAKGRKWIAKSFYDNQQASVALLRLQKGWSQAELAKRASTSQSYIARLELGKVDPQVSTVKKLAKALGVSVVKVLEAISPEDKE